MKLTPFALILPLLILLSSCSAVTELPGFLSVHKIDIQQGNIVDQKMVDQLKPGMTKAQVRFVLGTPLIADTFDQDRWDYHYRYIRAGDPLYVEDFSVIFKDGVLDSFNGDKVPTDKQADPIVEE